MTPDEIGKSYDEIADRWASGNFSKTNGISQHERAIAFAANRRNALDIGCGASGRIIDCLANHGFEDIEGLDISSRMIELARDGHPDRRFYHADITTWKFPKKYDFISGWDSIWHMPLDQQAGVMEKILGQLSTGGVCIFTTGGVDEPGEKKDAAMGPKMYHSALGIPQTLELISKCKCVCRHLEYDQYPELHVYLIVQRL